MSRAEYWILLQPNNNTRTKSEDVEKRGKEDVQFRHKMFEPEIQAIVD